jgi:excisionase family DNA binding protein
VDAQQVLSVHEAADVLGVSMQRVRQMIHVGQLDARRSSAGWLIPESAVNERSRNIYRGRPPEPQTAWSAVALLAAALACTSQPSLECALSAAQVVSDRKVRHRILRMLASLPDPVVNDAPWRRLLSARGQVRHLWAHPGVLDRLATDPRVSQGGAAVISAGHDGLTGRPDRLEFYVREADADEVIQRYRMHEDRDGHVNLVVVPSGVSSELAPGRGNAVPLPAAASDLLEEQDPRAHHAGAVQLRCCRDAIYAAGWLDRMKTRSANQQSTFS